jgi:hypothetical protein
MLTAGSTGITRAALSELAAVAVRELRTQGALSAKAIQGGSPAAAERTILETWRDYYVTALSRIPDMAVDAGDWSAEIAAAQDQVRRAAAEVLGTVGG